MADGEKAAHPAVVVRRVRRRRKRSFKSRVKKVLKRSGVDRHVYIVAAGVVGIALAYFLCDLLYNVFPMKMGR